MRHQRNNTCLLSDCAEGYRCDCFGFERCTISPCSQYTTAENAIPSSDIPFQCHLTPNAGTCTFFSSYLDSVMGADNAHVHVETYHRETLAMQTAVADKLSKMHRLSMAINAVLAQLDRNHADVSEEVHVSLDEAAYETVADTAAAEAEVADVVGEALDVFVAARETNRQRRLVHKLERAVSTKDRHMDTVGKAGCDEACKIVKEDIERLRFERKTAAIKAGTNAKKARQGLHKVRQSRRRVDSLAVKAEQAADRFYMQLEAAHYAVTKPF